MYGGISGKTDKPGAYGLLKTLKVIDFVQQYLKMLKNLNIEVMLFVSK